MFRFLVLGLLRDGRPKHGYALMKEYRARAGIEINTGSFYRELQKLVGEGLVRVIANPAGADARRTPYMITAVGASAFDRWMNAPLATELGGAADELGSRATFLGEARPDAVRAALEGWQEQLWIVGKTLERIRHAAYAQTGCAGRFVVLPLLLARRLKHIAADLEFLAEVRLSYENWTATYTAAPSPGGAGAQEELPAHIAEGQGHDLAPARAVPTAPSGLPPSRARHRQPR